MCVYVCVCVYMCVYVCVCVCMYVYVCVCVYMCVYVYVCVYVCICVYVYVYMCICVWWGGGAGNNLESLGSIRKNKKRALRTVKWYLCRILRYPYLKTIFGIFRIVTF